MLTVVYMLSHTQYKKPLQVATMPHPSKNFMCQEIRKCNVRVASDYKLFKPMKIQQLLQCS